MIYLWYILLTLYVLGVLFWLRTWDTPWWHRTIVALLWPLCIPVYMACVYFNDGGHL